MSLRDPSPARSIAQSSTPRSRSAIDLLGLALSSALALCASTDVSWAQDGSLDEHIPANLSAWNKRLEEASHRIIEAPTPPPQYLRRRWEWKRAREGSKSTSLSESSPLELLDDPAHAALLREQQQGLWSGLGQGGAAPLYESPQARDQRRAQMDLDTRGTPILPSYTYEFIPAITPHKRMTSWNKINDDGALQVDVGALTKMPDLKMKSLKRCVRGPLSAYPSVYTPLSLGRGAWLDVRHFDLECMRALCARSGDECFLGVFSIKGWSDVKYPRGVASVSPEQSLLTINGESALILSQDDAGNFYLSSAGQERLHTLQELILPISAPRAYFSGAWSAPEEASVDERHPDVQLPRHLKREALSLASTLGLHRGDSYEEQVFKLADWFRSFQPGEPPDLKGSTYRQLTISQIGVCRHRSYAFMITARALGIPTRYVTNQVHAFVEVLDPLNRWRRVDLGGEGVAPESDELTQPFTESLRRAESQASFHPDDGLPQPPAYREAARQAGLAQERASRQGIRPNASRGASDQSVDLEASGLSPQQSPRQSSGEIRDATQGERLNGGRSEGHVEGATGERAAHRDTMRVEEDELSAADHNETHSSDRDASSIDLTDSEHIKHSNSALSEVETISKHTDAERERSSTDSLKPQSPPQSKEERLQRSDDDPERRQDAQSTARQHEHDALSERERTRCPNQPLWSTSPLKNRGQVKSALLSLMQARSDRLNQPDRGDLPPPPKAAQVKLLSTRGERLHRCGWLRLKGRVRSASAPHYPPRGTVVLAALQSQSGGTLLNGWGVTGRRGRFQFRAQAPVDMTAGAYQLFVYLPKQHGWIASWSPVK